MVSHLNPGQIQPFPDVVGAGGVHYDGPETGGYIYLQLGNAHQPGAVLVASGKMADQISQGEDIQGGKLLCLGGADAPDDGNGIGQQGHIFTSF